MSFTFTCGSLADWALVALTGATLWKIFEYTRAARDQVEAQHRPIIVFERSASMLIRNIGVGPAMNVRFKRVDRRDSEMEQFAGVLPVDRALSCGNSDEIDARQLNKGLAEDNNFYLEVSYESISGTRYKSSRTWSSLEHDPDAVQKIERL